MASWSQKTQLIAGGLISRATPYSQVFASNEILDLVTVKVERLLSNLRSVPWTFAERPATLSLSMETSNLPYAHAVGLLVLIYIAFSLWRLSQQWSRARHYRQFQAANNCADPQFIPTPWFSGLWHKVKLIVTEEATVVDIIWRNKFKVNGPTHSLVDSFGVPRVIHTAEPSNVNAMLVTKSADWGPSPKRASVIFPLAPEALGATDGPVWAHNRKVITKHMANFRVKDTRTNEPAIGLLFDAIGPIDDDGMTETVDLRQLFVRMAMDLTTEYLLGTSFGSQKNGIRERTSNADAGQEPEKYGLKFDETMDVLAYYFSWRAKLGSKAWLADTPGYRRACKAMDAFIDELVQRAMVDAEQDSEEENAAGAARFGLVGRFISEKGADPVKIRNVIQDVLLAGQNMTGLMCAWIFAELENDQKLFYRVRRDVIDVFGTEQSPKVPMTWDNLRACKEVQNVISEGLRLYTMLPVLGRIAKRDTVLPTGGGPDGTQPIAVRKGTAASINLYIMHRQQKAWGEDAWKFKPDRWNSRKMGKEFAAFGGGPRLCIGMQLSMGEMSYVIARMMQHFDKIERPPGQDNLKKGYHFLLTPKHGVKVRLHRAS